MREVASEAGKGPGRVATSVAFEEDLEDVLARSRKAWRARTWESTEWEGVERRRLPWLGTGGKAREGAGGRQERGMLGTHEGATLRDQTAPRPLLPAPQLLMPEKLGISCPILRP